MEAHELAHLLLQEPEGTQVYMVDTGDQGTCYAVGLVSQRTGVTQIPANSAYLVPDFSIALPT